MCASFSKHKITRRELRSRLYKAYFKARRNVRSSDAQLEFELDLEKNMKVLEDDLFTGRYEFSPAVSFIISDPVVRQIFAPAFRDRIVSHLLYDFLEVFFEPRFIYDCYSCRVGKGNLFGIERLEHHIRSVSRNYSRSCYVLKMDIRSYFMQIKRSLLNDIIQAFLRRKSCSLFPSGDRYWEGD